ncbi:MAG TPA: hypothetical protein VEU29_04145, partial [Actinomycetota bacterium]|nr:hypothetical protein [Actinomycetota bacterium]
VFLVVWEDNRETSWPYDVYAARVTPAGRVLDGAGFKVSSSTSIVGSPAVASDGRDFLVAWEDWRNHRKGDRRADLYGASVLADGTVAETGIPISTARDYQQYVQLAWTGASYVAVWEDLRSGETGDSADHADVYATAITRGGAVASPDGVPVAVGRRDHGAIDVSAAGGDALVAWTEGCDAWRDEDCRRDVFARRLSARARPLGKRIAVATSPVSESYPAVMAGPRGYHVVWTRAKEGRLALVGKTLTAGARPRVLHRFAGEAFGGAADWVGPYGLLTWAEGNSDFGDGDAMDVYALRLAADGRPLDDQPLPVSTDPEPDFEPDVAAGPRGCAVISFGRYYQSTDRGVRSFSRFLGGCSG